METPVVTFLGYITYKYFLKTTVELKARQCSLCGCWLQVGSRLGPGKELPSPMSCWPGGVPKATKSAAVRAQEPKSSAHPSLSCPGPAWQHRPSVCLCGVCVCPWARGCSWPGPGLGSSSDLRGRGLCWPQPCRDGDRGVPSSPHPQHGEVLPWGDPGDSG